MFLQIRSVKIQVFLFKFNADLRFSYDPHTYCGSLRNSLCGTRLHGNLIQYLFHILAYKLVETHWKHVEILFWNGTLRFHLRKIRNSDLKT